MRLHDGSLMTEVSTIDFPSLRKTARIVSAPHGARSLEARPVSYDTDRASMAREAHFT
jgi:hypothetical protein